ncbi:hypothetical protein C2857_006356 [Epichloe festucae Fl1]|uniref:Uncharacterized protein n=1 Tax=Epichloe festucae (strain Fl1) TaxID=877507 RepID=A0A7S9KLX6_EPIFF|nr:hypothetical protein C2857_006356 [Epichloe festucae Fl1]
MMLTLKQPTTYGYRSVHDLPTPPATSRPSPPPGQTEALYHPYPTTSRNHSPISGSHTMSATHRGLPPPAAMALPPQQASSSGVPPTPHHGHQQQQQQQQPPPTHPPHSQDPSAHGQPWTTLPPPPQHWHGSEEAMRHWLQAKAEEEKTRQEEEKTRQESLRLEQRRVEMDMLRDSIRGGIPPPMIPLVFAGMGSGGALPQAALDWAQQFFPPSQSHHLQLLPPQRQQSPDAQQREGHAQSQGPYHPGPSGPPPPPPPGPGSYVPYPASPSRPRGQTVSGVVGRTTGGGNVPAHAGQSGGPMPAPPYGGGSHESHMHAPSATQETSPSLYFHHWQPPATQSGSGSSNRLGSPPGNPNKKRKATGSQSAETPGEQRLRSPPPFIQSTLSNPPPARRGGHKRQKSDVTWYRPAGYHSMEEAERAPPPPHGLTPNRDVKAEFPRQERYLGESSRHSVSTLLTHDASGRHSREASRCHFQSAHEDDRQIAPRHREEVGMRRERGSPRRDSD